MIRRLFLMQIFFQLCLPVFGSVFITLVLFASPLSADRNVDLLSRLSAHRPLSGISLSLTGEYLVGLIADSEEQQIYVWSAEQPVLKPENPGDNKTAEILPYLRSEINWLAWVGGNHLILSLKEKGLVLYDAANARLRPLIDPLVGGGPRPDQLPPTLLSTIVDDPSRILMQWEDPDVEGYPAVYEVDVKNGVSTKIVGAWKPIIRWWATPKGKVLAGEGYRARRHQVYSRDIEAGWRKVYENDVFKDPAYIILGLQSDDGRALVISNADQDGHEQDKRALWYSDINSGRLIEKLASTDNYDIAGAVLDMLGQRLIAATYTGVQNEQIFLDEAFEADHDAVLERLKRRPVDETARVWFAGNSKYQNRSLFQLRSEHHPIRYFLYDRSVDGLIALDGKGIQGGIYDDFHRTTAVNIPVSRKPSVPEMQGILSVPKAANGRLALSGKGVLLIHGGPVRRSKQQYSTLLNWLTSNGYVVLQPNFRGSSGFGDMWRRAGYREWGNDMQDDISRAAKWLIKEGYVKKDQLCAIGGSYGGYASLLGVIKDKKLFQCAVSLNGVTSVPHLVNYLSNRRFSLLTTPRIKGNLSERTLRRRSPLYIARKLKRPVLLLHATNDANVPFEHGQLMAAVLKQNRSDYEFIVLPGAEHQLKHPRFRKTYYENALRFLEQNIGDKPQ